MNIKALNYTLVLDACKPFVLKPLAFFENAATSAKLSAQYQPYEEGRYCFKKAYLAASRR
jgi:hypothetical protein